MTGRTLAEIALDDRGRELAAARPRETGVEDSGRRRTSSARARFGRRRMKPRSSSARIRRWMPDLERRSSASFISSKEGGTPVSFRRSLMKRSSSLCLRVNIQALSLLGGSGAEINSGSEDGKPLNKE